MSDRAPAARLDSLTGLRFFAAFLVLQHHFSNLGPIPGLVSWEGFGKTGVTFFFVLSGYVLTWSRKETDSARGFYWRRFARIWPLHLVATALAIPVFYDLRHLPVNWAGVALSLLMLQAWVPVVGIIFAGNPAAWSLSCETFFYALHPPVARVLSRRRPAVLAGGAVALLLVLVLVARVSWRLPVDVTNWLLYASPVYRLGEFLIGVMLAVAARRGVRLPIRLLPAVALLAGWFMLTYNVAPHLPPDVQGWVGRVGYAALPALYGLIIAAAAQADLGGAPTLLRHPMLIRLGNWSYALYLTHATIIYAVRAATGTRPESWWNIPWLLAITAAAVAVAGVLYHFVEHPLERYLRGLGARRQAPAVKRLAPLEPALDSEPLI